MNITYLLGAGASANCLPTYNNFRERFNDFYSFLRNFGFNKSEYRDLLSLVKTVNDEFVFHSTPDTIAKKYFHTDSDKLINLKRVIILFFLYEQTKWTRPEPDNSERPELIKKDTVDKRYDAFIASILKPIEGKIELTPNFKILTWNYDMQFEIAYSRYKNVGARLVQQEIQSYPQILKNNIAFEPDKFSVIHLNGIAYDMAESQDFIGFATDSDASLIDYLLNVFHNMLTTYRRDSFSGVNLLSFAWEKLNGNFSLKENTLLENAFLIARDTQWLIAIGYSFPSFNRIIDSLILNKMTRLERVSIQSLDYSNIKKIVSEVKRGILIDDVGYSNQFFIPDWTSNFII